MTWLELKELSVYLRLRVQKEAELDALRDEASRAAATAAATISALSVHRPCMMLTSAVHIGSLTNTEHSIDHSG